MFPEWIPAKAVRGAIDGFVDHLVTNYADTLEALASPVLKVLIWLEQLLRTSPWWSVVLATIVIAWLVSRRIGFSLAMGALLCVLGLLGLWDAGMQTLALMIMGRRAFGDDRYPGGDRDGACELVALDHVAGAGRDADHAEFCLSDSGCHAVWPGQNPRPDRHGDLCRPALDPPH